MLRLIYLAVVGFGFGAATGAGCGNFAFWMAVGAALGLVWHRAAPNDGGEAWASIKILQEKHVLF